MAATKQSVLKLLTAARQHIEDRRHWMKGDYDDGYGRYCAVGALTAATGATAAPRYATRRQALSALEKSLPSYHRERGYTVEEFNDAVSRKHKDILDLYDRAIASVK